MTQEQKAKRYDEALERARRLNVDNMLSNEAIEEIFPEVAEREDERIINQLITLVNSAGEVLLIPTNKEELVAWLNKCKESLHIQETCKENADSFTAEEDGPFDEDEFLEDELSAFLQNYDKEYDDDAAVSDVARHFYEIGKKQNEQKSVPFSCGHENGAKWSEEDEKNLERVTDCIYDFYPDPVVKYKLKDWLKSLRPQSQGIYQQVVKGIRDMCDRYEQNGMFTDERARDFLGNVRVKCKDAIECAPILDEPSWKPSEEQMEALNVLNLHGDLSYVGQQNQLISLYQDLKKLM